MLAWLAGGGGQHGSAGSAILSLPLLLGRKNSSKAPALTLTQPHTAAMAQLLRQTRYAAASMRTRTISTAFAAAAASSVPAALRLSRRTFTSLSLPRFSDAKSGTSDAPAAAPAAAGSDPLSAPSSDAAGAASVAAPPVSRIVYSTPPNNRFDLIVIGSGPAGQKCAISAAKHKKRVAIVDKKEMFGGVCIHTGTIPSKTFREAIIHLTGYRQRGFYGKGFVRRDDITSQDVLDRVKKVEQWETQTILDQLHRNRVTCIQGTAKFLDAHHVEVVPDSAHAHAHQGNGSTATGAQSAAASASPPLPAVSTLGGSSVPHTAVSETNVLYGEQMFISCGTRPAQNSMYPFDSPLVFDADAILQAPTWDKIRHLIVIGGGVIAMEYASMFNALPGCRVTIIDDKPSILDFIDAEVVQTLKHIMGRQGATFRLGERVTKVEASDTTVSVTLDSGKQVIGDALFYAVGRQANTDSLNLDAAGVLTAKRGLIPVNDFFQTSVSHIYAAGDVIGFPALASTAMEQGRLASNHMWGFGRPMKPVFPYGIYTIPEISVIGASEQELTRNKVPYEVGIAKFEETAKGQMVGGQHIDGFLKLLFCPHTRKLLGCCAIGESSVEIIHIGQVVMSSGGSIEYFRDSVFNYPTMAETYRVAALDGLGRLGISS